MNILLLTPDIPFPSESGAAIRNWGIICGLTEAGHSLTLLTFTDRAPGEDNPLRQRCQAIHALPLPRRSKTARLIKLLATASADMESRLKSQAYEIALRRLLRESRFDIVQFSGLELGSYLDVISAEMGGAKVIYDALNAEADLQRVVADVERESLVRAPAAWYSRIQASRLAEFEKRVCNTVDAVIAVSDEDHVLLSMHGGAPVTVMPNGIHVADYHAPPVNMRRARTLVFTGKMDYRPNVDAVEWFCADVLPRARKRLPDLQFKVVGKNPHPRLQALAQRGDIQLTGWVESVLPHLHQAALYVVPLRMGSGTRLKILQAMAAGCAIISTSIGAAGLNEPACSALAIADDAETFADAVVMLLHDDDQREALGELAKHQALAHYDWPVLLPRLFEAYARLGFG